MICQEFFITHSWFPSLAFPVKHTYITHMDERSFFFLQDVVVVHYPPEVMEKNQILVTARTSLRSMGIEGLHHTPCFKTLLQNLPNIILEQYQAEKVSFCCAPVILLCTNHSVVH